MIEMKLHEVEKSVKLGALKSATMCLTGGGWMLIFSSSDKVQSHEDAKETDVILMTQRSSARSFKTADSAIVTALKLGVKNIAVSA